MPPEYRLRCRDCQHDLVLRNVTCPHCGLVDAHYHTEAPGEQATWHCDRCQAKLPGADVHLDSKCGHCGGHHFYWWSDTRAAWHRPDLSPAAVTGPDEPVWLSGQFDGDYEGRLTSSSPDESHRLYSVHIVYGEMQTLARVSGPPQELGNAEPLPIRQLTVPVKVALEGHERPIEVVMHDFRLHESSKVADVERGEGSTRQVVGRIRGKGYGYVLPTSKAPPEPLSESPPPPAKPALENVQEQDVPSCLACRPWVMFLAALLVWWGCGWKLSLLALAVIALSCALDGWLQVRGLARERTRARFYLGVLFVLGALLGGVLAVHWASLGHCETGQPWPLVLPALALILSGWLSSCLLRALLTLIWVASLLGLCGATGQGCGISNGGWHPPASVAELVQNVQGSVQSLQTQIESQTNDHVPDDALNDPTLGLQDLGQTSIDAALDDPASVANCSNAVYFPQSRMFDINSDVIRPEAEPLLAKLLRLTGQFPDRRIVITGHTDISGEERPNGLAMNMELSQRRAIAVANWLIARGVEAHRLDTRGAGSSMPLTSRPGLLRFNRRVDVRLDCPMPE